MFKTRTFSILIILIIVLSTMATLIGIFSNYSINHNSMTSVNGQLVELYGKGIYHNDSQTIALQARAQDSLTLILGIPILIYTTYRSLKGSTRSNLLLLGTLGYFLYSYTSYVFLAQYNHLFIIYIAIMSLSFFAFIICFSSINLNELKKSFKSKFPRKSLAIFLIFFGIMMSLRALSLILPSIFSNTVPVELEHYTSLVIQGLDLSILLPTTVLSGILLLKNAPLGYLLSIIVLIKSTTLVLAVDTMLLFMHFGNVTVKPDEVTLFSITTLIFLYFSYITFKKMK
ncbi:hypothetical protein Q2T76_01390 [Lactobacillus sp. YT155]|uniref:hypothetical protein n=1 Tax=Lactobacillus sp. YT155 TaxID=3060955 RepID=UPI00265D715D|nr:hypothetical protein [Lactobacillus sp. YT155]MDO1604704.1 hypothetical protein [Lactobacillus sp. YT155]